MKAEQEDTSTFQPKVNEKSSKIAMVKRSESETECVVERLYKDAAKKIEK